MLKPIRTVMLKTVGLWLRFARGIMERAASTVSCGLSESELVFAMGAARERDDLMSVLELLDEVLDLIKRGFDRHTNALTIRIINNIEIMLRRGGFSREYSETLDIYSRIHAAVEGRTENFSSSECRREIHKQLALLRAERTRQAFVGERAGASRFDRAKALRLFGTISERGTFTLNTLNSGMLRIMTRNSELLKMLKSDKAFMELSLKNIGNIRRRTERAVSMQRFLGALTEEQTELPERFVVNDGLFRELREKSSAAPGLKYLLEHSSEKSLSEFFGRLEQRIVEQIAPLSERSYFDSFESMREFFVGAQQSEIKHLIKELERDGLYRSEVRTLTDALRLYETETEKRMAADLKLTELYRIAEAAIKRRISAENFSEERFTAALGASHEMKRLFADYAWENYRSEETVKRYFEYMRTVSVSEDKFSYSEQTMPPTGSVTRGAYEGMENSVVGGADNAVKSNKNMAHSNGSVSDYGAGIAESAAAAVSADLAGKITKESFADFLINSGELGLKFSESVRNSFLNASPDVAAAFAEYLVSTVREDSFAYYSGQVRALAGNVENILYRGNYSIEERSAETFALIYGAWNENALQLSELYENFTQTHSSRDEILKLYSRLPKNNIAAVSEFLEAAAQGDAHFVSLSDDILKQSYKILGGIGGSLGTSINTSEYTFYNALSDLNENTLELLMPLVVTRGSSDGFDLRDIDVSNIPKSSRGGIAADGSTVNVTVPDGNPHGNSLYGGSGGDITSAVFGGYNALVEKTSAYVISAAFAEYLSGKVRGDSAAYYNERIHTLAGRLENVLRDERSDIFTKTSGALALIYGE